MEKDKSEEYESDFEVNQEGTGIHLPGFYGPIQQNSSKKNEPKKMPGSVLLSNSSELRRSKEGPNYLHIRDALENRALDWLEQELMARMITKIVYTEPHRHHSGCEIDEEESSHSDPDLERKMDLSKNQFILLSYKK